MGETGFTVILACKASPSCKATVWQQHTAVAQPTLSYLELSLVSYIFDFGFWPMQGIKPRHGHLDLSRKKGKTSWNAFELGFAGITVSFSGSL